MAFAGDWLLHDGPIPVLPAATRKRPTAAYTLTLSQPPAFAYWLLAALLVEALYAEHTIAAVIALLVFHGAPILGVIIAWFAFVSLRRRPLVACCVAASIAGFVNAAFVRAVSLLPHVAEHLALLDATRRALE